MKEPNVDANARTDRPFGIREWLGGYGWLGLGIAAVLILSFKTGTVGAPSQASARSLDSLPTIAERTRRPLKTTLGAELPKFREQIALEKELRRVRLELDHLTSALATERERSHVLEESYRGLDEQFEHVAQLIRTKGEGLSPSSSAAGAPSSSGTAAPGPSPVPIEAIYVLEKTTESTGSASQ